MAEATITANVLLMGLKAHAFTETAYQLSKSGTLSASESGDERRRVMRSLSHSRLHNHGSSVGAIENLSVRSTEVQ
jgi:hypothetical protein